MPSLVNTVEFRRTDNEWTVGIFKIQPTSTSNVVFACLYDHINSNIGEYSVEVVGEICLNKQTTTKYVEGNTPEESIWHSSYLTLTPARLFSTLSEVLFIRRILAPHHQEKYKN